ncbi:glycosyltransferase [Marinihelvus fidelis]|uniref:Glycosyltransferase n=1 Tax=Marinihelvus fidelis TaxID=2613842 RepID=A0A5N0TFX3_9GAMM|nr:glycosyltransferase [Marinihelvus fidelis]KAA9133384.1 glycosyltransferase [Marinihelvus fidelis]
MTNERDTGQTLDGQAVSKPVVLVLGMHRSGTSLLCGLLESAGVYFGEPSDFMAPNEENPKGFREHLKLRHRNDELLFSKQCDWAEVSGFDDRTLTAEDEATRIYSEWISRFIASIDSNSGHDLIGVKDPRLCLLAPLWYQALGQRVVTVFVNRMPEEIATSLATRNGFAPEFTHFLTERYLHLATKAAKKRPHIVVNFEDLVLRPVEPLVRIQQFVEAQTGQSLKIDEERLNAFSDKGLYRSQFEGERLPATHHLAAWFTEMQGGALPDVPEYIVEPTAEILRREHEIRFNRWEQMRGRFQSIESRYVAITRPELTLERHEIPVGFESLKGIGEKSIKVGLDEVLVENVLAHLYRQKEGQHSLVAAELRNMRGLLSSVNDQRHALDQLLDGSKTLLEQMAVELPRAREETEALRKQFDSARKVVENLEFELKSAITEKSSFQSANIKLQDRLVHVEAEFASLSEAHKTCSELVSSVTSGLRAKNLAAMDMVSVAVSSITEVLAPARQLVQLLGDILDSKSWKLIEPQLRLLMAPATAGFGETSLDLLKQEFHRVRASLKACEGGATEQIERMASNAQWAACSPETSIIVLTRNGAHHLKNLFTSYLEHHRRELAEWLIVDHASDDETEALVESLGSRLPLRYIKLDRNDTYSRSNNLATVFARGRHMVFCNNDIIFDRPVIQQLTKALDDDSGIGAVGLNLYYPSENPHDRQLQHGGINFRYDEQFKFPRPYNVTQERNTPGNFEVPAVTAALMACRFEDFWAVGGFNEGYVYGYEDVDLSLTIHRNLNKKIVLNASLSAIHDESASQKKDDNRAVAKRRLGNIELFRERYNRYVTRNYLKLFPGAGNNAPFRLGLVVTDDDPNTTAGDYFTASELASSLTEQYGWECRFLPRLSKTTNWYDCRGLDGVLVLIDAYDLRNIKNAAPGLVRMAWLRNWFDRWVRHDWFDLYDIAFCSSEKSANYVSRLTPVAVEVMKIATNPKRFDVQGSSHDKYESDYCFTGSYWNARRDIEDFDPNELSWRFQLFGSGWDDHEQFQGSWFGPVPYDDIPAVYASTKLVIDDANHVTRPWGSVNSRVFDALASGALVLSNGQRGAAETFDGELPTWDSADELTELVDYYLSNPGEREALVNRLRGLVLERHTYDRRARSLNSILEKFAEKTRVAIKLPVPRWDLANEWGDYHLASALARSLQKLGYRVRLDVLSDWYEPRAEQDDVVIVMRGLSEYEPRSHQLNIMWNISHPDKIESAEYERYDLVFVASVAHAHKLDEELSRPVLPLLQCTDPARFNWRDDRVRNEDVLFVGNSRGVLRDIVRDAIEAGINIKVYGTHWEKLIDRKYIAGEHIDNAELADAYANCAVVLNDHWETMREYGFVSNRLFDLAGCGAVVVSDSVPGIAELFGNLVYEYDGTPAGLKARVEQAKTEAESRMPDRKSLAEAVAKSHCMDARAGHFHQHIQRLLSEQKKPGQGK